MPSFVARAAFHVGALAFGVTDLLARVAPLVHVYSLHVIAHDLQVTRLRDVIRSNDVMKRSALSNPTSTKPKVRLDSTTFR